MSVIGEGRCKIVTQPEALKLLSTLSTPEKWFVDYITKACIHGQFVAMYQKHRLNLPLFKLLKKAEEIGKRNKSDMTREIQLLMEHMLINAGLHHYRDNIKRTPSDLGLLLNKTRLNSLGVYLPDELSSYLFDPKFDKLLTEPGSLSKSCINMYDPEIQDEHIDDIRKMGTQLNAVWRLKDGALRKEFLTADHPVVGEYISNIIKQLQSALMVTKLCEHFDDHTTLSIEHLVKYFEKGDIEDFRQHSKHWVKMNNRVEYTIGFIEEYEDPLQCAAVFQGSVRVKVFDMNPLAEKLQEIEKQLPFDEEHHREDMSDIPNVAVVYKLFGTGGMGPMIHIAAYCLPNFEDIRREGSKQVMFSLPVAKSDLKHIFAAYSSDRVNALFKTGYFEWLYNVEMALTTLHETVGHASGKQLVTKEERNTRLGPWGSGLEEMRAEIIAIHTALEHMELLTSLGYLDGHPDHLSSDELRATIVESFLESAWTRWSTGSPGNQLIKDAHAQADTGILYYLLEECGDAGLTFKSRKVLVRDQTLDSFVVEVRDIRVVREAIAKMVNHVQRLSSTVPAEELDEFMNKYAATTRLPDGNKTVKALRLAVNNGFDGSAQRFPRKVDVVNGCPQFEITEYTIDNWTQL